MNIGAHYHQMEYKEDLDLLIHWLQEFNRPNDYYERQCQPRRMQNQAPRQFNRTKGSAKCL
jgi:hypothetical protein